MNKYKFGDKVKLKYPDDFDDFGNEWKEFWSENINTIFTIHSVINNNYYYLQYPNGNIVMANDLELYIIFYDYELELYILANPLPDELFKI